LATFVLVHGSRHGGWCWQRVARALRAEGHEVSCPTLAGAGERAHVAAAGVNLDTHVEDVAAHLFYEDLRDVVLVGHSYAGMVVTGAAERARDRIKHLVYLDALVPRGGESHLDLAGPLAETLRGFIAGEGEGLVLPAGYRTPAQFGVTDPDDAAWVASRLTDQPAGTYEQRLRSADAASGVPRTFVRCLRSEMIAPDIVARATDDPAFAYVEIDADHDAMITAPELVAEQLIAVAARLPEPAS
jgi:pimeloyl-ACP methyl ester carboxylesterase